MNGKQWFSVLLLVALAVACLLAYASTCDCGDICSHGYHCGLKECSGHE